MASTPRIDYYKNLETNYNSYWTNYLSARSNLLNAIRGYSNNSNTAIIIKNNAGTKITIMFIKSYTISNHPVSSTQYNYDLDITGTGMILYFNGNDAPSISSLKTMCSSFDSHQNPNTQPAPNTNEYNVFYNLTDKIRRIEFYGRHNQFTITSVVENSTVMSDDDIADIDTFTTTQFINLCGYFGANTNSMPLQ